MNLVKKSLLITVCGLAIFAAVQSHAQTQNPNDDTILVRKSDLPATLVRELQSKQQLTEIAQKVETYGKWVGIGKELGTAVNESLNALTTQADKLSKTDVGKFTMFMVAYKVLGNDAAELVKRILLFPISIVIMLIGTWVCIRSLRRMCWGMVVLEEKGTDKTDKKEHYKFIDPTLKAEDNSLGTLLHGIGYIIFIALMYYIFLS